MKNIFYRLGVFVLFSGTFILGSCDPEIEERPINSGNLDFSKYIAVGNSLTAGYMDGGVYREGQLNSYPNILAGQFRQVGGGDFVQPLFSEEQANGSGYLRLSGFTATGSPVLTPVTDKLGVRQESPLPGGPRLTKFTDANLQNLAVPNMSVLASAVPQYGALNPYYERLLEPAEVGTKPYLQFMGGRNHTFFSYWLGNIDVLTYATNGGVADLVNNPFSGLTDANTFRFIYTNTINLLTANSVEGVVGTIPNVTAIPFFTTVTVPTVRVAAKGINPALDVYIKTGPNTGDVRLAQNEDLILLTTQAVIGRLDNVGGNQIPHGFHPANPLTDREVLDKDEVAEVQAHTVTLNNIIREIATAKGLAIFDAYAFFNQVQPTMVNGQLVPSLNINGIAYSPAFITGNLFSLDGVHPTPRGYAIVANEMIKAINNQYGSSIPTVDITKYRAVLIP